MTAVKFHGFKKIKQIKKFGRNIFGYISMFYSQSKKI